MKGLNPFILLLLVMGLIFAACSQNEAPKETPLPTEEGMSSLKEGPITLNTMLADVAKKVPSFGGMFVEDEELNIYVKNLKSNASEKAYKAEIFRALKEVFGEDMLPYKDKITLLAGQYSIQQLHTWYQHFPDVLAMPEVAFTDLAEQSNRLKLGYSKEASVENIKSLLLSKGIPLAAVLFEESEFDQHAVTVRDRIRDVDGGLQITFSNFRCTLGLNAQIVDGPAGFITNSHCSDVQGVAEATLYYQSTVSGFNLAGYEVADPALSSSLPGCPTGRICRYSDSNFSHYLTTSDLGEIARIGSWGSLTISGLDPNYEIIAPALFILSGEALTKIGRTTGKTAGLVSNTCIDTDVSGSTITMLCQYHVQGTSGVGNFGSGAGQVNQIVDFGDSGSPVFKLIGNPNPNHEVGLYGLLWGKNTAGDRWTFSPIGSVVSELTAVVGPFVLN